MRLLDSLSSGSVYLKDLFISVQLLVAVVLHRSSLGIFYIALCCIAQCKERGQELLQKGQCPVTPEGLRTYVFVWK